MRLKNAGRMMKMLLSVAIVRCWLRRMKLRDREGGRLQRGGDAQEENDEEKQRVRDEQGDVLGHFDPHLQMRRRRNANACADATEDRLQLEDDVLAGHEAEEGDERVDNHVHQLGKGEMIELRQCDNEKAEPTSRNMP